MTEYMVTSGGSVGPGSVQLEPGGEKIRVGDTVDLTDEQVETVRRLGLNVEPAGQQQQQEQPQQGADPATGQPLGAEDVGQGAQGAQVGQAQEQAQPDNSES